MELRPITAPDDPLLVALCDALAALETELDRTGSWPARQLDLCARAGIFQWFVPRRFGGQEWNEEAQAHGYLKLGAASLTTAFIITQRSGATQRIAASDNEAAKERLLPDLASGATFATVGISHLTTSRRHLGKPALAARETKGGYVLDGYTPWVTGAARAATVVVGAELVDGRQVLLALPMELPGIEVEEPLRLVGLSASYTGPIRLRGVEVPRDLLLFGPAENVMKLGTGGGTGGLQTSTLALAVADAAIAYLEAESVLRGGLAEPADQLRAEQRNLVERLLGAAVGSPVCSNDELRSRANSIALRASQAALGAAKGAGYIVGHPAGRLAREALFFLVWSCPQGVLNTNLCELAGLE